MNYAELIERVEKCGPAGNFQLECDLALALGVSKAGKLGVLNIQDTPPAYTVSLDAAIALVEAKLPGWEWRAGSETVDGLAILLTTERAATPALTLLLALLKALEGQQP